jgi:hypothetical protein
LEQTKQAVDNVVDGNQLAKVLEAEESPKDGLAREETSVGSSEKPARARAQISTS